jgi:hypothetical protein
VTNEGNATGGQSGGFSDRNIDAMSKENSGEMSGNGHTTKFRQSAAGATKRYNNAVKAGNKNAASKMGGKYNERMDAAERAVSEERLANGR